MLIKLIKILTRYLFKILYLVKFRSKIKLFIITYSIKSNSK